MSRAAKFLVATIGGGLLLGAAGGHLVNPVMQQRSGDEPWRNMLGRDAGSGDSGFAADAPPQEPRSYGGRYSYAPAYAETTATWADPYEPEWLEYDEDWPEPPTFAELDSRWDMHEPETSPYSQTEPSPVEAAARADQAAEAARAAADPPASDALPREPRVAQGQLPAIW